MLVLKTGRACIKNETDRREWVTQVTFVVYQLGMVGGVQQIAENGQLMCSP